MYLIAFSKSKRRRSLKGSDDWFFATTSQCYTKGIQNRCCQSPLFTGLICCPKDEMEIIHICQECLCSFCKNTGSCACLTQIYTNTLLYICELELPTDRADGSTIPTDPMLFTIPSNPAYDVLRVLLLLSLHARNQVDDYSGTLGSLCKKRCPHFSSGHKSLNCCAVLSSISKKN